MVEIRKSLKEIIIGKAAEHMVVKIDTPPVIANAERLLKEAKVAFITTSGIHLKDDKPFNTKGDHTFRIIPGDVDYRNLTITHNHYDKEEALKDKNCVFPLEILREFVKNGVIKDVAPRHFGLMGYIPKVELLINESAPRIADILAEDGVDIALLSPG